MNSDFKIDFKKNKKIFYMYFGVVAAIIIASAIYVQITGNTSFIQPIDDHGRSYGKY